MLRERCFVIIFVEKFNRRDFAKMSTSWNYDVTFADWWDPPANILIAWGMDGMQFMASASRLIG